MRNEFGVKFPECTGNDYALEIILPLNFKRFLSFIPLEPPRAQIKANIFIYLLSKDILYFFINKIFILIHLTYIYPVFIVNHIITNF